MSTVDVLFEESWNKEAKLEYTQMESLLKGKITEHRGPQKTHNFQLFTPTVAKTSKARHAEVEISAQDATLIPATVGLIYEAQMIDDWDAAQNSFDYRNVITKNVTAAVWKKYDDKIITALAASTSGETTLPTGNTFNYAAASKMAEVLDTQDVPMGDRFGLISAPAMRQLQNDSVYINNFHFKNEVVKTGIARDVAGFDLIKTNRLGNGAAGNTERRCYFWHKDAVGMHIAQDFKIKIDWVPTRQGYLFTASMLVGTVIIDNKGVQYCDVANAN